MIQLLLEFFKNIKLRQKKTSEKPVLQDAKKEKEEYYENPYLEELRGIMEQILKKRGIKYEDFAPVLIEGEEPEDTLNAAVRLSPDLNYLTVIAEKDTYYQDFVDNMYEEHGLIVNFCPKDRLRKMDIFSSQVPGNVILDFQKIGGITIRPKPKGKLYIPIFKRKWEGSANLDITVPIGYNTVIVRRSINGKKQPGLDKFEKAFYENK